MLLIRALFSSVLILLVADSDSPITRLRAIDADVKSADATLEKAWALLPDWHQPDANVDQLRKIAYEKHRTAIAKVFEIANADPQSDVGFDALEWLLLHAPEIYSTPDGDRALQLMTRYHALNPKIGKAVQRVGALPPYGLPHNEVKANSAYTSAIALLKKVAESNPDATARGHAAFGLARQAKGAFEFAESKAAANMESRRLEAIAAFDSVVKNYGNCPYLGPSKAASTLGELAETDLFELRDLRPGKVTPEIAGQDIDGIEFKLSDYRGKVVLLVFWASWCGPCMADVPHERELVTLFSGKPFALIGVNGDEDKAKALRAVSKNQISWRSFWNGTKGAYGPISIAWNVHAWPKVYVIDQNGVIRYTNLFGKELDTPLTRMVAEAEAAKSNVHE